MKFREGFFALLLLYLSSLTAPASASIAPVSFQNPAKRGNYLFRALESASSSVRRRTLDITEKELAVIIPSVVVGVLIVALGCFQVRSYCKRTRSSRNFSTSAGQISIPGKTIIQERGVGSDILRQLTEHEAQESAFGHREPSFRKDNQVRGSSDSDFEFGVENMI